ncbi:MAG: hypothetical protein K0S81_1859 [Rhodospirillales bacterium]|jgi:hypothetical protein|nr:hypothetical protein [Rhodospirillales bacterium]
MGILQTLWAGLVRRVLPAIVAVPLLLGGPSPQNLDLSCSISGGFGPASEQSVLLGHGDAHLNGCAFKTEAGYCASSGCAAVVVFERERMNAAPKGELPSSISLASLMGLSLRPDLQPPILASRG